MITYLLDVNVLLALAWPNHTHYSLAHNWLTTVHRRRWATCPATQAAFVRLSCNPAVVGVAVPAKQVLRLLAANTASPDHVFWEEDRSLRDILSPLAPRIVGHRQVMDAYLLGQAIAHGGILTTLDTGIRGLLRPGDGFASSLEVITAET